MRDQSAPSQPDPQRRSEKSRRAILDAALDLCAEHGYGPVTVEAIAARAGVSKKTIYRWWPSKGAVVLEALDDAANPATGFPDTQHDPDLARGLDEGLIMPRAREASSRLAKAGAAGQIHSDTDADTALELLYGPVYYRLLLHQGDLHSSDELRTLVDHVLRALAPPAAP